MSFQVLITAMNAMLGMSGVFGRSIGPRGPLAAVLLAVALPAGVDSSASGQEAAVADSKVVAPEEVASREGQRITVEMRVKSSRLLADAGRCYLNSRRDYRDETNVSIVLFRRGLAALAEKGVEDPADHFLDKVIRVTGTVEIYKDKPQIIVERAEQIELAAGEGGAAADRN